MGFLDKLLGRTKDTAEDVAEKAAPAVDKAEHGAEQAWDTSKDVAEDAADKAKDTVSELTHRGDEAAAAEASEPDTTGSSPTAA